MTDYFSMLHELLAVIHRDGGHRIDEIGLDAAFAEAMELSAKRAQWMGDHNERLAKRMGAEWKARVSDTGGYF